MLFVLKTLYEQDFGLFKHAVQRNCYLILLVLLLIAPFVLERFYIGELSELFIWCIAGTGLMLLVGYTGLVSLGHAAFMALGAYANVILNKYGVPFPISIILAAVFSGLLGALIGVAALRMTGIYLAVATLAFAVIVEKFIGQGGSFTGGHRGFRVENIEYFGLYLNDPVVFYLICLVFLLLCLWFLANLLRSPTGRAFIAIRDSEISAQAMGIDLVQYKTLSFALSAAITGMAGALYAYKIGYLYPETFTIFTSIKLLMLVVVGGLGSMHGIVFGAMFIALLPQLIALVRDLLPLWVSQRRGLEPFVFGSILIAFLIFEPQGIYGRWLKVRLFFNQFPMYRKATFKRQKSFLRTERVH